MATGTPNFAQVVRNIGAELGPQHGIIAQDIVTADAGGLRIDMLGLSNTEAGSHDVTFTINDGTNDRLAWTVTVPASAGYVAATPPVDGMSRSVAPFVNEDGAIWLQSGWKLRWAVLVAVASSKAVRCTGFGASWS